VFAAVIILFVWTCVHLLHDHVYNNCLMALYPGQPGELVQQLAETLTQYTTLILLEFLTRTLSLPSQASQSVSVV